jgi:hypothetical protein
MKTVLLIFYSVIMMMGGCDRCKNYAALDNGILDTGILELVPYSDGQSVKFVHSEGQVINFDVSRDTRDDVIYMDMSCYSIKYQVNTTIMEPDYPAFSFQFDVSNIDSTYTIIDGYVGMYWWSIPSDTTIQAVRDALNEEMINGRVYDKVFKVKTYQWTGHIEELIYADSAWYSYDSGVVKVIMSNGENYTIDE